MFSDTDLAHVMTVSRAKTAEAIEIPSVDQTDVSPKNHALYGYRSLESGVLLRNVNIR